MKNFRDLSVWQKSHQLTLGIYKATTRLPKHELFGLTSQMRRSAASIPANIAEGCGRGSDPDFARLLQIGMGSASELEYHLLLARDLLYLPNDIHGPLESGTVEVKRMLAGLMKRLRS